MSFDSLLSALWFFFCIALLFIVLAPLGTLTETFVKHISSGKLLTTLLVVNELIMLLFFAVCIHYLDSLITTVDLSTFAEFNLSIAIYAGSLLIQKAGDWVKKNDEKTNS